MFFKMSPMSSTFRAYCDGLSASTSTNSKYVNTSSRFSFFSSAAMSATRGISKETISVSIIQSGMLRPASSP